VRFSSAAGGRLSVEVTSTDEEAGPRNFYRTVLRLVAPDLSPTQTVLEQIGPGRYAGTVHADDPGAYLVRVAQTREDASGTDAASRTLGLVSPAAVEYRRLGIDADALRSFASVGGGRELALTDEEAPATLWAHDIAAQAFPTPIWPWLLLIAILLVPLDVGVRRVALSGADVRRVRGWVARRVGLGRAEPEAVPGLAELRAARERTVRRTTRGARPPEPAVSAPPTSRAAAPRGEEPPREPERPRPDAAHDTLAERLARRRRGG
jgi:hypothetical protein